MKRLNYFLVLYLVLLSAACSGSGSFNGIYQKTSGSCSSSYIELKKVQGFGDKYYLVKIYKKDYRFRENKEFLGVIKEKTIYMNDGSIRVTGNGLIVTSGDKSCLYLKK